MEDPAFVNELEKEMKSNFDLYINHDWAYFGNESYFDEKLGYLFQAKEDFGRLLIRVYFHRKKELLEHWADLVVDSHSLSADSGGVELQSAKKVSHLERKMISISALRQ